MPEHFALACRLSHRPAFSRSRAEPLAETGHGLFRRDVAVREWQNFGGSAAGKAEIQESPGDGRKIGVAKADGAPVTVSEMDVAEIGTRQAQRLGNGNLLDVGVKEVDQELYVLRAQRTQQGQAISHRGDEIGLITIQRLEQQRYAQGTSARAELFERFAQPFERLLACDVALVAALHGTNNRGRAETAGKIDDAGDEGAGLSANLGVGIGEAKLV